MIGRGVLHAEHHRAHQQRHGRVEALDGDGGDAAGRRRSAGVVEQHIEPAEGACGLADHALPVVLERGVGLHEAAVAAEPGCQRLALGLAAAGEDDLGAFLHEQLGRAGADAAGGPRDDRDLAVEHAHARFPLLPWLQRYYRSAAALKPAAPSTTIYSAVSDVS